MTNLNCTLKSKLRAFVFLKTRERNAVCVMPRLECIGDRFFPERLNRAAEKQILLLLTCFSTMSTWLDFHQSALSVPGP